MEPGEGLPGKVTQNPKDNQDTKQQAAVDGGLFFVWGWHVVRDLRW